MSGVSLRLGTGAGFSSDRLDPAVDLVERGALDAIVFECIGERTLAFGHRDRRADPSRGYNPLLERRLRAVLPAARRNGTRIVTNMGVANPLAAAERAVECARELDLRGVRVAAVLGDDVSDRFGPDTPLWEAGTVAEVGRTFIGANAYLGADALLPAFEADADVVITGRVADPSLFLAPMRHHFGWAEDDWPVLGQGTVVGHLMECAAQVTGGYFDDPGYKDVPDLARVGSPLAEIAVDASATITKLDGTGGLVDRRTVKEQLLYEIHDPARYATPDVTADFTSVDLVADGTNRVRVRGGGGAARPQRLKVTVAFDGGYLAEAGVSYAGAGARDRGCLAGEIVAERMGAVHGTNAPVRIDLIGVASLHASAAGHGDAVARASDSRDVRLRCAMRASSREEAELLLWEVESLLCCGPAGGAGYRGTVTPSVMTDSASLPRDQIRPALEVLVS